MRLIDADKYKGKIIASHCYSGVNKLINVDDVPTAYDVDKVVEQLKERTAFLKDCVKYGNKTAEHQSKSYDTMMMYDINDLVDDLLEIVKAGGKNE